jgi:hypothetical protein
MEIVISVLAFLGSLSVVGIVCISIIIFNHEREELRTKAAIREKRRRDGELWDSEPIKYLNRESFDLSARIRVALNAVEKAAELGRDAHKRIDDNRKRMFLIESYYDERIPALEDEVRSKKKAKKC